MVVRSNRLLQLSPIDRSYLKYFISTRLETEIKKVLLQSDVVSLPETPSLGFLLFSFGSLMSSTALKSRY